MKSYDQIKNQLQAFEVELDKDKLWANTAHAIPRKRKRRGIVFLLAGFLALVGAGLFMLPYDKEKGVSQQTTPSSSEMLSSRHQNSTATEAGQTNQKADEKAPSVAIQSEANPEVVSNSTTTSIEFEPSMIEIESGTTSSGAYEINKPHHSSIGDVTFDRGLPPVDRSVSEDVSFIKNADAGLISSVDAEQLKTETQVLDMHQFMSIEEIDQLPFGTFETDLPEEISFHSPTNIITPVKQGHPVDLYFIQSVGLTTMDVQAGNSEAEQRAAFLNQQISSLESFSTRLGGRMHLSKRWIIGTGLQWNQLITQTDFAWTEEERISGEGISDVVIDPDGTQHFQTGEVGISKETLWNARRYTNHNTLNLEAQFAYRLIQHYRMNLSIGMRATYNLLYQAEGSNFDSGDQPIAFTPDDQPYELTSPWNFGFSLMGSYQFNRHWGLMLDFQADRLHYRENLNQIPIIYKHNIFALGVGLQYVF